MARHIKNKTSRRGLGRKTRRSGTSRRGRTSRGGKNQLPGFNNYPGMGDQ